MPKRDRIIWRIMFVSGFLAFCLILWSPGHASSGLLWVKPSNVSVQPNEKTTVEIQMDNVTNVYGAEFHLSFNPTVLTVVDNDPAKDGVQIGTGACPLAGFVALNTASNSTGTVDYALAQLYPQTACNGGLVASIEFQCLGNTGSSAVNIDSSIISDPDGFAIDHTRQNGNITCGDINKMIYLPLVRS
jgi:hypothetical protein